MGATADPTTVPSCTGIICCGVCSPSFISQLPSLFQSGSQAIASITQSNNQVRLAETNAAAQVQIAGIKQQSASTMYLVLGLAVVAVIVFAFKK
jgi:hypothetical protein